MTGKQYTFAITLAACLATVPALGRAEPAACGAPESGRQVPVQRSPDVLAYQVVAPDGTASILMGSMHIPDDRIPIPDLSVLDGASRLVLEDAPGRASMQSRFAPVDLASVLTPDQIAMFRIWAGCWLPSGDEATRRGVADMLLRLPLDLVSSLAVPPGWPNRRGPSRETWLTSAAQARGIPVVGLETSAEEVVHRNQLPERVLIDILQTSLSLHGIEAAAAAVAAVADGNDDAVLAAVRSNFTDPADADLFVTRLIAERNAAWLDRLQGYLATPAVVIVGAGHVAGPQGLVALLQTRGYRVKRIMLPASEVGEGTTGGRRP